MTELEQIKATLAVHLPELKREYNVEEMGIFGSVARGETHAESDVDIWVTLSAPLGFRFMELERTLETLLNREVDLVMRDGIKTPIKPKILADSSYVET